MEYRLVYFDVRALAEPIRWIFAYTETTFIDERIPWDYPTWFSETKSKFSSTVGQIPVLHQEGFPPLCQSQAISRYLATKFGLVGKTDWDNARIDEIISLVFDLFIAWRTLMFERDPERKAQGKVLLATKFRLYYSKFAGIVESSSGDYIIGDKLTHADFWLASFISIWDDPLSGDGPIMPPGLPMPSESDNFMGLTKEFPALKKHKELITSLPKIKDWIAKRHQTIA